jgi:hypothetical protein
MARVRPPSHAVIWDGTRRLHGGLLCVVPEVPARPSPDPPVRRRGRPSRAGSPATRKIEVRLTLGELQRVRALAQEHGCTMADLFRDSICAGSR